MKKLLTLFILGAAIAAAQSSPAFGVFQGLGGPTSRPCFDSSNVGAIYTQIAPNGQTFACQQNGASSLGAGAYSWVPVAVQASTGTSGTITVAAGKAAAISNSLTFAGTDGVTLTFPTTSATIARTDAANTFTGVQTFSSAPVLSTSTLTSGAGTITFPTASITVPGTVVNNCGTANACSATLISSTTKVVIGHTATLNGASPSVAAVTGMPAFTSSSSYVCTATLESASASTVILAVNYVSSSAVTFTAGNGATGVVSYLCIGS